MRSRTSIPIDAYSGWACIRYGVGETLFRYSDSMELEPWLATGYELVDDLTWKITLRDGVTFSSGRKMDGAGREGVPGASDCRCMTGPGAI